MSSNPTGWICPRCQRVNAPTVLCCQCGQRESQFELSPPQPPCAPPDPGRFICGPGDLDRYSTGNPSRPAA